MALPAGRNSALRIDYEIAGPRSGKLRVHCAFSPILAVSCGPKEMPLGRARLSHLGSTLEAEGLGVLHGELRLYRLEPGERPRRIETVIQDDVEILARAGIPAQPAVDACGS